ncbi:WD_domain (plasmid) [Leishmania braziliensis MHOM/BR/75/M2904]|nr:WD_domain [Leishmania braziliensis MHOM/BR/75/M2904]
MHATGMRSSASANLSRTARPSKTGASISPSRTALSRGASPAMLAAVHRERGRSTSPSTQKKARLGAADDVATVVSGSAAVAPTTGHGTASTASPSVTGVSPSYFAQDGRRFEPNTYETTFNFRGQYEHIVVAHGTATLWCANTASGAIDLYSCVTGQFVTSLRPLHEEVAARQVELSELPLNTSCRKATSGGAKGTASGLLTSHCGTAAPTPRSRGLVSTRGGRRLSAPSSAGGAAHPHESAPNRASASSPVSMWLRAPEGSVRATALCATATHVWVGYTNGSVAVYDALLLKLITFGQFHTERVVSIVELCNMQIVSASASGLLILWDTEQGGFEAVTRVTVLLDSVREGAGALCAMTSVPPTARVCCGFESGVVYSVLVASRPQGQTTPQELRGHQGRVNAMAVVRDVLFTASEDSTVCVWHRGGTVCARGAESLGDKGRRGPVSSNHLREATHDGGQACGGLHTGGPMKMLKRITVSPCVRSLLAEEQTCSLWVAYADGLMERWSANPDDDYGVEEVVEGALTTSQSAGNGGVRALLSLSVVQTMQWLALSSNGVNKVWYGHQNTLEIDLANSISTLAQVVEQDTEDAAAWRERVNLLKQKEAERREKYVCILEQLSEQRVLLRHYDMWKRSILFVGARRKRVEAVAHTLEKKSHLQLIRRFFGQWASFYDAQQRHIRAYVLAMALSRATEQLQLQAYFLRWQSYLVYRQVRQKAVEGVHVLARLVNAAVIGSYFHRWRAAAATTIRRQRSCISAEQLALLASKAQRQVLQRALRQWVSHTDAQKRCKQNASEAAAAAATSHDGLPVPGTSSLARFAAHHAQMQQQQHGRRVLQLWRRWTERRARQASLAAVAALREQQLSYETGQRFFLRWRQRVHARHMGENMEQLKVLEMELRRAEAEHGDIFEKLQLQRQLDLVLERQAAEEARLAHVKDQLASAEQTCSELRARQRTQSVISSNGVAGASSRDSSLAPSSGAATGASAAVALADASPRSSIVRLAGTDTELSLSTTSESPPLTQLQSQPQQVVLSTMSRGHMASNAAWYRAMVDQQRLSPIVLAHMPTEEAVHHVMGQLKGNVVNLYTDLALFRQVKDRRRAGTSAVGILLEAFGEVKRLIVITVRGASANAASAAAARMGGKATRWPLSMEALDCIPVHHCATVLSAIKTLVVAYDLLQSEDMANVQTTCEEVVVNADWIFLIARACYLRRKPAPPVNNRQLI